MKDYTEQQKALALRYVVEEFGEEMEPEETALLMEVYLDGMNYINILNN